MLTHFSASNTEVGKDTILFILMSRICLQALAPTVVPELECVVQCRCQYVFTVR